jgi:tetratricopeptide (TPR) repeat protein
VQGRYAEAEPLIKRSLAIREKVLGSDHPDVARSLNNLADLYERQGRYAEAQPLFERALSIRGRAVGPDHPDTATSMNNLASFYQAEGRAADALPLVQRLVATGRAQLRAALPVLWTRSGNNWCRPKRPSTMRSMRSSAAPARRRRLP